jgi:hypothetical protein
MAESHVASNQKQEEYAEMRQVIQADNERFDKDGNAGVSFRRVQEPEKLHRRHDQVKKRQLGFLLDFNLQDV